MSEPRQILEELATSPGAARDRLRTSEDTDVLLAALRLAPDENTKAILCDVLGFRHEAAAVDDLIQCLNDPAAGVRSSAADALAKIGDPRAGIALMARFELPDPNLGVRRTLVAALGAVRYRPAIPRLIEWLENPDAAQRGGAAWSLGAMHAEEALPALEDAARRERLPYPQERIREAIEVISAHRAPHH